MPTINLKEHYPTTYTEDFFVEVSEEIHQLFIDFKHQEDAFLRQVSRHHAYHSLDDPNFPVEQCVLFQKPALVDAVEQRHSAMSIYEAILSLPPKQAKRCYDHYYQGFKISDIAQKEGVTAGSISECIKSALSALRERCNFFQLLRLNPNFYPFFVLYNIGMFFSIMESAPCILHAPPHNIAIIDKGKDEEKI